MKLYKIIEKLIPPFIFSIYQKFNVRTYYKIGRYKVKIPKGYNLPNFQKNHKLYDRFLPVLAKNLTSDKLIVDVGANIGDTVISLIDCCRNPFLLIEPSDIFFPYLEKNIKVLSEKNQLRVTLKKTFAGTNTYQGYLVHQKGGTASVKLGKDSNENSNITLDDMVPNKSSVILIKVDVDGYDFDVVRSAKKIISQSKPILFWENQILEEFQYKGFNEMYELLIKNGYKYIYVFDNFGNLITEETSFETLININTYLYSMVSSGNTRTIYYVDVCASTDKYSEVLKNTILEYKRDLILK